MAVLRAPPPRRKACERCMKGKRRCDLQRPSCGRCRDGSWSCTYSPPDAGKLDSPNTTKSAPAPLVDKAEVKFEPVTYPPQDFAQEVRLPPQRLTYCATKLQESTVEMAKGVETFFIKPMSSRTQLPRPLQDAFVACSLHLSTTDSNSHFVRHVLLETYSAYLSAEEDLDFEAELAKVQAAVLLHIPLLFDGDIRYRSLAESYIDTLREKVLHLQRRDAAEMPEHIRSSRYARWLFMESVRRTIITSTFVECIYVNLRDGVSNTVPFLAMLPLTVAGRLWRANSEEEWERLSKVVPLTILPYGEALGWWRDEALQHSLDTLQHLLYVACKGFTDAHA
ncbi:uncharacterized protein LTR77_007224 [Saxophila tyrrhenica]|uniref:Zn(2)-C6 fungal-type domain-containing protein n=1 Tax=Saxophila tyrrhenica TaxID=1690608 RepID=A0AAV9P829_9PEZI|nr:hypothetical protein LTR77_007224 [Saxophila tyrrhenica]